MKVNGIQNVQAAKSPYEYYIFQVYWSDTIPFNNEQII